MKNIDQATAKKPPFPNNYSENFLVLEKGEGCYVEDIKENRYLDFGSGIAVNALGYGRKDIAGIAAKQMEKLIHVSNLYTTRPTLRLAAKLTGLGNFDSVHFGSSGSEANEAALKYARLYSLRKKGENCHKILSFSNSFHGRTMGALSATSTEKYRKPFEPLVPGFEFSDFNDIEMLKSKLDKSFAAVIVEPLQGEGGLNKVTDEFAQALNDLCTKHDIILIADEVQTGIGRTGLPLASAWSGLNPDIVTLAKPLAAGLPLSATLIPAKVNSIIQLGEHGTTFGGGPVTCAVADAILDVLLDPEFLFQVQEKAVIVTEEINKLSNEFESVIGAKGIGLLQGIELKDINPSEIIAEAMKEGLLVLRSGNNLLRIAPPLIINEEEIKEGFDIIRKVLQTIENKQSTAK